MARTKQQFHTPQGKTVRPMGQNSSRKSPRYTARKSPRKSPSPRKTLQTPPSTSRMRNRQSSGEEREEKMRPGERAARQIRQYKGSWLPAGEEGWPAVIKKDETRLLIPKASFQRLVKDVCQEIKSDLRMEMVALSMLHHAAENHLVEVFADTLLCAEHRDKETIEPKDLFLVSKIRCERLRDKQKNNSCRRSDPLYNYNAKHGREDGFMRQPHCY